MVTENNLIAAAKGDILADLLIKNCKIINTRSGQIKSTNLAIYNGKVVGFGNYHANKIINARGQYLAPGFIDGHVHIESSMLAPTHFAKAILAHGTTTIIADPHEIVNVMGLEGLDIFLRHSQTLPVDIFFMMPSCVPATTMETAAYKITTKKMKKYLDEDRILGLGEMMNFPGIINRHTDPLEKINLFRKKIIDGHAPLVTGKDLSAYIAAGITSDHESSTQEEASEKLEKGIFTLIREGSAARNLEALLPLVNKYNSRFFGLCTDDRHPDFLVENGHIDHIVKKAINLGLDPIIVFQLSSMNTANFYRLGDRGDLTIGKKADFVLFDSLDLIDISEVYKNGQKVVEKGEIVTQISTPKLPQKNSVNIPEMISSKIQIPARHNTIRTIEIIPNQLLTKEKIVKIHPKNNLILPDITEDLLKLTVIERHSGTGNIATAFVKGFGLTAGAIGSTVAHDSHNLIIVGTKDSDILTCVDVIKEMKGGLAVVKDGEVLSSLALPFGGIMSDQDLHSVKNQYDQLLATAQSLGCKIDDPFMQLSFLALPVIPEIKLTDQGLVNVSRFDFVSLFPSED